MYRDGRRGSHGTADAVFASHLFHYRVKRQPGQSCSCPLPRRPGSCCRNVGSVTNPRTRPCRQSDVQRVHSTQCVKRCGYILPSALFFPCCSLTLPILPLLFPLPSSSPPFSSSRRLPACSFALPPIHRSTLKSILSATYLWPVLVGKCSELYLLRTVVCTVYCGTG